MFIYHVILLIIMCDGNKAVGNTIIPTYVTDTLKYLIQMTYGFQNK